MMSKILIKDASYTGVIETPISGVLGDKGTVTMTIDMMSIVVDIGDNPKKPPKPKEGDPLPFNPVDHVLSFKPEAIGDRMALYDLESPKDAVEALARELVFRLMPTLQPVSESKADQQGGKDARIEVKWTNAGTEAVMKQIEAFAARIDSAHVQSSHDFSEMNEEE